jgi:HEAT repeats
MSSRDWKTLPPSLAARYAARHDDIDFLIELVSSSDPQARISAAGELRKLRDARAVPALVRCLQRPATVGKVAALKALREIGDADSADAVFDVAQSASEAFGVRAQAAQVLLSFGDRRGVVTLASLYGEPTAKHHSHFRKWGLRLLVESNGTEALPTLRAARSGAGVLERAPPRSRDSDSRAASTGRHDRSEARLARTVGEHEALPLVVGLPSRRLRHRRESD